MVHPLLVHLPIGILALATVFEWLGRKEGYTLLRPALPLVWRLGAISAILSCISGWWMRQSGNYSGVTIDYHQWTGWGTALIAIVICFLKTRLAMGIIALFFTTLAAFQGGALTHGANYLWPNPTAQTLNLIEEDRQASGDSILPDSIVEKASKEAIWQAQKAGLTLVALGPELPWLSVSFFNLTAPHDSLFRILENLAPQIVYLNLAEVMLPENAWSAIGQMPNLVKLNASCSNITDTQLPLITNKSYLYYLNLTQTDISLAALNDLKKLPRLRQLFLYQSKIKTEEWPLLFQNLRGVTIDTGNYQVPTFSTDTTFLKEN